MAALKTPFLHLPCYGSTGRQWHPACVRSEHVLSLAIHYPKGTRYAIPKADRTPYDEVMNRARSVQPIPQSDPPSIGAIVRETRLRRNMTQADLAACVGCMPSDISRIESGHVTLPRRARIEAIAQCLKVSSGQLLAASGFTDFDTFAESIDPEAIAAYRALAGERRELMELVSTMSDEQVRFVLDTAKFKLETERKSARRRGPRS